MIENLVAVDPGFEGTGWAYWTQLAEGNEWNDSNMITPLPQETGVIRLSGVDKQKQWMPRAVMISSAFGGKLVELVPQAGASAMVLIELPEYYGGSAVGHAAAQKGDLTILTVLTGMLLRVAWDCGWNALTVTPTGWKGQMNKRALKARIGRVTHTVYRNHEADAVGLGLHLAGLL